MTKKKKDIKHEEKIKLENTNDLNPDDLLKKLMNVKKEDLDKKNKTNKGS